MRKYDIKTGTLNIKIKKNEEIFDSLVEINSRINKKRGFIFVSKVLGKHYPSKPSEMYSVHKKLAKQLLKKVDFNKKTMCIGFAETATGIGQGVFESVYKKLKKELNLNIKEDNQTNNKKDLSLNLVYQHSTRYVLDKKVKVSFEEEHCHAPSHIFYDIEDSNLKENSLNSENIILIDDEISTGNTAINFIKKLKNEYPNVKNYYICSILNWVGKKQLKYIYDYAKNNEINIHFVSLIKGTLKFKYDYKEENINIPKSICNNTEDIKNQLTNELSKNYGRTGISYLKKKEINKLNNIKFDKELKEYENILVLGTGEFMHVPFRIGKIIEKINSNVFVQSTTRSPLNIDLGIKNKIEFKDNYFEDIDNFLYNITDKKYDLIIICYETKTKPLNCLLKEEISKFTNEVKEIYFNDTNINIKNFNLN